MPSRRSERGELEAWLHYMQGSWRNADKSDEVYEVVDRTVTRTNSTGRNVFRNWLELDRDGVLVWGPKARFFVDRERSTHSEVRWAAFDKRSKGWRWYREPPSKTSGSGPDHASSSSSERWRSPEQPRGRMVPPAEVHLTPRPAAPVHLVAAPGVAAPVHLSPGPGWMAPPPGGSPYPPPRAVHAACVAKAKSASLLHPGCMVRISGIPPSGETSLNDQCGVLHAYSESGRWRVELECGLMKEVHGDHLMRDSIAMNDGIVAHSEERAAGSLVHGYVPYSALPPQAPSDATGSAWGVSPGRQMPDKTEVDFVEAFLIANRVDPRGSRGSAILRRLSLEQQKIVCDQGPLVSSARDDRFTELQKRCFLVEHTIDADVVEALNELPLRLQSKVMNEGPLGEEDDASAVLISRICDLRDDQSSDELQNGNNSDDADRSVSRRRSRSRGHGGDGGRGHRSNARRGSRSRSNGRASKVKDAWGGDLIDMLLG